MRSLLLAVCLLVPAHAIPSPPKVVTDIPPVQSLVAQVMQGVATPDLIVPPGASPHGFALRPSQARALQDADLVIWIGEDLTPWLARPLGTIGASADTLELLEHEATGLLPYRENAIFSKDAHGDHEDHGDHGDHEHHDHAGDHDPHAWLDPQNAISWLHVIALKLSEMDPGNAAIYTENAEEARRSLKALASEVELVLAPVRGKPFLVFHDAFHYFEHRFDIEAQGAVSAGDAAGPGAARLTRIRDHLMKTGTACVFIEPQLGDSVLDAITEGTDTRIGVLDPLGVDTEPGPDLYPALIMRLATVMAECLQ